MITVRSPQSFSDFGLSRPNNTNMAAIEVSKPIRWVDSDMGVDGSTVYDLVTQQPYQAMLAAPDNAASANFPAAPNVLDFATPVTAGLMDAGVLPTSFRSLTFMALFDVKGTMSATYTLFQIWDQANSTGSFVNFLVAGPGLFFSATGGGSSVYKVWTPALNDVKLVAGTFNNGDKALKYYEDDMSAPAPGTGSLTDTVNTVVPDGHRLFIGTPINSLTPMKIGLKSFLLWDRALTAAELTSVGAAVKAIAGL